MKVKGINNIKDRKFAWMDKWVAMTGARAMIDAKANGTYIVYSKDGQLVKEYPNGDIYPLDAEIVDETKGEMTDMEIDHPKRDFDGKYDYYYVNQYGGLTQFISEETLVVGSIIYLTSWGSSLYKIVRVIEDNDKKVVTLESFKAIVCDQPLSQ